VETLADALSSFEESLKLSNGFLMVDIDVVDGFFVVVVVVVFDVDEYFVLNGLYVFCVDDCDDNNDDDDDNGDGGGCRITSVPLPFGRCIVDMPL
jgi:hypothetical protein